MDTKEETYNMIINNKFSESDDEHEIRIKLLTEKVDSWPEWKKRAITYIPTLIVNGK